MSNLPKVIRENTKRLGRGVGSGKGGHTTGRGQKGQKARYKVHILFEGVKNKKSLLHRLPFLRGKSKNKRFEKPITVSTDKLIQFKSGDTISIDSLVKAGIVKKHEAYTVGVKIVKGKKDVSNFKYSVPTSLKENA